MLGKGRLTVNAFFWHCRLLQPEKMDVRMRLATIVTDGRERLAICLADGCVTVRDVNRVFKGQWPETMDGLIEAGQMDALGTWYRQEGEDALAAREDLVLAGDRFSWAPPYRRPGKIWGIGLNYRDHAADLSERAPTSSPASFMKPHTAIAGPGETIMIPRLSRRTTAEAELGIIIGKRCKDVSRANWRDVVAGFTTILDMTAEDIL
jgi:2-keto-4-pentenoate hydratase/2-oxohepta-3-ene-1,7-dioic acid hydratase in catechol pathway